MSDFQTSYPAFFALIGLLAGSAKIAVTTPGGVIQKLEGEVSEIPSFMAFYPLAGSLKSELGNLEKSPADIEAGVEVLVADLAFSSAKAQAIIQSAIPLARTVVTGYEQSQALINVIKA